MKLRDRNLLTLILAVALPLTAGAVGAIPTMAAIPGWYAKLRKPRWRPPDRVFGPVWTTLYLMMGLASWLVWRRTRDGQPGGPVRVALGLYALQLVANAAWSLIFFGAKRIGWALIETALLWSLVTATVVAFWRVHRPAGLLLVPYQLWTSFAAVLTAAIWRLNR